MRIAILILGLILGAFMFFQTFLVYALSGVARDSGTGAAGAIGLFMALLWLVACALVIPIPLVSAVVFAVAGVLGFAMSSDFPDLAYWGGASIILAVLSVIGWFTKRRGTRRQEAREAQRHAELVASVSRSAPASVSCPSCGTWNTQGTKYCSECGTALSTANLATN
jgi:hypothetical protein